LTRGEYFHAGSDYLEVIFDQWPGYLRETSRGEVMEKVDEAGNILGFSVMRVSALKKERLGPISKPSSYDGIRYVLAR
jgi:hypothetical protein